MSSLALLALLGVSAPVQAPPTEFGSPASVAIQDTTEVIATGTGIDHDGASADARRSALDKAVGALVDAETRLKNDEIIEEIVSASAGFIESYEEISREEQKNGLWRVKARVVVRKNLLKERLVQSKVIVEKVSGGSLFAEAMSKANNKEATATIIAKNLADYPLCAMKVELAAEPEVLTNEGDLWTVGLQVAFTVDPEGWEKSAKALRTALSVLASRHAQVDPRWERAPQATDNGWARKHRQWWGPEGNRDAASSWSLNLTRSRLNGAIPLEPDEFYWAIPTSVRIQGPYDVYAVPRALLPELARISAREVTLIAEFKDSDGSVIHRASLVAPCAPRFPMTHGKAIYASGLGNAWASGYSRRCMLTPEVLPEDSDYGTHVTGSSSRPGPLVHSAIAVLPNWIIPEGSKSRSPVEGLTVRIATDVEPQALSRTQAIELRLESSFTAGTMAYQPRSDSTKYKSVRLEPLRSESE